MPDRQKQRLVLRSHDNGTHTVELDGQELTFITRVELVIDGRDGAEARLTIPGTYLDADVAAFVTAHAAEGDDASQEASVPEPGAPIHYRHPNSSTVCLDAWIVSTEDDGTSTITFPGGMNRRGVTEDQSGRGADTWHWPCNGHDEPDVDGIAATYQVTFAPDEVKGVRQAAKASGQTVCAYLHDLAVERNKNDTVNITVDAPPLTKQDVHDAVQLALHRYMTPGYPPRYFRR